jgi:hypothetical protein
MPHSPESDFERMARARPLAYRASPMQNQGLLMNRPDLAHAMVISLERSQRDLTEALAVLRLAGFATTAQAAEHLLARAISRLEMMRLALGNPDDGPILT